MEVKIDEAALLIAETEASEAFTQIHRKTLGFYVISGLETADYLDNVAAEIEVKLRKADVVAEAIAATAGYVVTEKESELLNYMFQKQDDPEGWRETANENRAHARNNLDSIRELLTESLDEEGVMMLDNYCAISAPDSIQAAKSLTEADRSVHWGTWLGEMADDEQLLEFLRWNVDKTRKQQSDPAIGLEVEAQRVAYKEGIRRGISEGWLHPDAVAAIAEADGIKVYMGDIFDTSLKGFGGYHEGNTDYVVIAVTDGFSSSNLRIVKNVQAYTAHELNHAVLGSFGLTWIDEALTEHIAQSINSGQPEVLDPDMRGIEGIYPERRRLLATFLEAGRKAVPVSLATKAYSDKKTPEEDSEFTQAVNDAWQHMLLPGESALKHMSDHVVMLEEQHLSALINQCEDAPISTIRLQKLKNKAQALAAEAARQDLLQQPEAVFARTSVFWRNKLQAA